LFPKAVIHLAAGDIIITANGAAKNAPYIQNLTINGQAWNKPWFRFSDLRNGAKLSYDLSASPDTSWGSAPSDAPPSYDGGLR
jgi:putative alpha-1,2-mannosidase